jgi:hypothetical protein
MRFYKGVVLTKDQQETLDAETRKKYGKVNIGLLFATMAGLTAGLNTPQVKRKPPTSLEDLS